jgi:hypothetical protein
MAMLKPFTDYHCSNNCGHGHYTGAGHLIKEGDDKCYCGGTMVTDESDGFRYRLEFESISPHQAAEMVARYGKDVWPTLTDEQWASLEWHPVSKEAEFLREIQDQHGRLQSWAVTHGQPIRNVRLSRATANAWESVPPASGSE